MMNVPYVVLKYATLLLSFPVNNVVEVVLTTLTAVLKSTKYINHHPLLIFTTRNKTNSNNTKNENSFYKYTKTPKQQQYIVTLHYYLVLLFFGCNTNVDNGNT